MREPTPLSCIKEEPLYAEGTHAKEGRSMQRRHPRWPVFLALGACLLTAPALGQEQSSGTETIEQRRSPAEDRAETEADRDLLERIRQSLRENTELSDTVQHIRVRVNNGEVVLRGEVKSEGDKAAIESQVRRIEGVQGVRNRLQVAGAARETSERAEGRVGDLEATFARVVEAFNSRDVNAYVASVHEQAVLFWLSPFPADGKEAFRQTLRAFFDNLESVTVTPINPQFRVIDSSGLAWGHAQFAVKPRDGLVATSYGRYLFSFTRAGEQWLVTSLHLSPLPPG
jgi:ketosteroid isomerase-like protein